MNCVTLSFCSKSEFIYVILIILQQCNFASNDKLNCAISSAEFDVEKLHFEAVAAYFVSTSNRKYFLTYRWDKKWVSHFQKDNNFHEIISFATNIYKIWIFVRQKGLIFFLVIFVKQSISTEHFSTVTKLRNICIQVLYIVQCTFHVWYERFEAYSLNCVIQIQ